MEAKLELFGVLLSSRLGFKAPDGMKEEMGGERKAPRFDFVVLEKVSLFSFPRKSSVASTQLRSPKPDACTPSFTLAAPTSAIVAPSWTQPRRKVSQSSFSSPSVFLSIPLDSLLTLVLFRTLSNTLQPSWTRSRCEPQRIDHHDVVRRIEPRRRHSARRVSPGSDPVCCSRADTWDIEG